MVNVYLHGMLGKKFGKEWLGMEVQSISEALHAIDINCKGLFRKYFQDKIKKEYKIKIGKSFIEDEIEARGRCGNNDIHIVPVIKGRNSGWGKIFAAAVILAIMWWNPGGWAYAGATATSAASLTSAGTIAASISASLAMGGIAQLLSPRVSDYTPVDQEKANSHSFGGNVDTVLQGNPLPIAYGRVMISPLPISASLIYDDYTAGGVLGTDTVTVGSSDFNTDSNNPPNSPVGQNISIFSTNNYYLNRFGNTVTPPNIGPTNIPSQITPYPTNEIT